MSTEQSARVVRTEGSGRVVRGNATFSPAIEAEADRRIAAARAQIAATAPSSPETRDDAADHLSPREALNARTAGAFEAARKDR
jgi:hypothetical protein